MTRILIYTVGMVLTVVKADYDCVCNYAVVKPVYPLPNNHDSPTGYMHVLDCKSIAPVTVGNSQYKAIAFEHKVGYVELDQTTGVTTCQGDPPSSDILDVTGSPLAYLGVGYNLLYGIPRRPDRSNGGGDIGMNINRRVYQLTTKRNGSEVEAIEAEVTSLKNCVQNTSSFVVHDGRSYQMELLSFADIHDDDGNWTNKAFILNQDFMKVRQNTEGGDRVVYQDIVSSVICGSARYKEELAVVSNFGVSQEFAKDVCQLPLTYNATTYSSFTEKWGTHIVTAVKTGTLTVNRYQTTPQQVLSHLDIQGNSIVRPTEQYGTYPTSVTINSTKLANMHITRSGTLIDTHQLGTITVPVAIHIALSPITDAIAKKYWTQIINHAQIVDTCSNADESALKEIKANLKMSLIRYATYKTASKSTLHDQPMTIPMTWPYGTYGLMQAATGCPGSKVPWGDGYRRYDTEDNKPWQNYFSDRIEQYMAGDFGMDLVKTRFCMKTSASVDNKFDRAWPSGTYCILKRGVCPLGFMSGSIKWDDQDMFNGDEAKGELPDGEYNSNTKIYYCCRNDGSLSQPMFLPREKPFVLLRYGTPCQAVYGMVVTEVIIRWDDEDLFNSDDSSGAHPFDDGGSKDHKLHFCHYRERPMGNQPVIIG